MAQLTQGEEALKTALKYEPRIRDALVSALRFAQGTVSIDTIERFIIAGNLEGLLAHLDAHFAKSIVSSEFIRTLDQAVREAGAAAAVDIDGYMSKNPGLYAAQSAYAFGGAGGIAGEVLIATATPEFSFNMANPKTVAATKTWQGNLIREMSLQMRKAVMVEVQEGILAGQNPRKTAKGIKQGLGLTSTQQAHVKNFRADLDKIKAGNIRSLEAWGFFPPTKEEIDAYNKRYDQWVKRGRTGSVPQLPMRTKQIARAPGGAQVVSDTDGVDRWRLRNRSRTNDRALFDAVYAPAEELRVKAQKALDAGKMEQEYRDKYITHRATTIARTESLRAANLGGYEAYRQLVEDSGLVTANQVGKKWLTAGDSRVRDTHRAVNGQKRKLDAPFLVDGALVQFPPHGVNCRCTITYDIELNGVT